MRFEKLDPRLMLDATGQLLQSVNFAASGSLIGQFPTNQILQTDMIDFDGDPYLDLIMITARQQTDEPYSVSVFLGTETDFVFDRSTEIPLTGLSWVEEIAAMNLNGDDNIDFVLRTAEGVLPYVGADNGTFQSLPPIESRYPVQSLEVIGLATHGVDDIVFTSHEIGSDEELVSVYLNDGAGQFTNEWEGLFLVEANPTSVVAGGDYDVDGDNDIFVAVGGDVLLDTEYLILENDGSGDLFEFAVDPNAEFHSIPTAAKLEDMNGDGNADIIVGARSRFGEAAIRIAHGDGKGEFGTWAEYDANGWVVQIATGDLNGDSDLDVAFTYENPTFSFETHEPGVGVIFSNAGGELEVRDDFEQHGEVSQFHGKRSSSLAISDLNGDGLNDIRFVDERRAIVDGAWQASLEVQTLHQVDRYRVTDFAHARLDEVNVGTFFDLDSDGYIDYVGGTRENFKLARTDRYVTIQFGKENGKFSQPTFVPVAAKFTSFGFADKNADGHTDIQARPVSGLASTILLGADRSVLDVVDSEETTVSRHQPPPKIVVNDLTRNNFHVIVNGITIPRSFREDSLWPVSTSHIAIAGDFNSDGIGGDVILSHLNGFALLASQGDLAPPPLPGDVDLNGAVNFTDFLILANNFGRSDNVTREDGDLNEDGIVAFTDFLVLANNFGRTSPA